MTKAERQEYTKNVGKCFVCDDGIVRWIQSLSTRGYYSVKWKSDRDGLWYSGGIVHASRWKQGREIPAPTEWKEASVFGHVLNCTRNVAEEAK